MWDWEARRGRSLLSRRSGAFPEIGVSAVVIVVVHRLYSFCSGGASTRAYKKPPSCSVDEGYTPYRGTTTIYPARGPPPVTRDHNAGRPSRANGRIPGTATISSPSGSGVSRGRTTAALSALAFSPRESLSVTLCALAQSPSQPVDSMQCACSITYALQGRAYVAGSTEGGAIS